MPVGKGVVALLGVLAVAGPALAQGSLRLPPMPESTPPSTSPPTSQPKTPPTPAPTPSAAPQARSGWPSDPTQQVKAIQVLMHDLGLYGGTTNGTLGPATRAAIREFQRSINQPESGEPSESLFNELLQKKAR